MSASPVAAVELDARGWDQHLQPNSFPYQLHNLHGSGGAPLPLDITANGVESFGSMMVAS